MRQYFCECQTCHAQCNVLFDGLYPESNTTFSHLCPACGSETLHTRVLTRKQTEADKAKLIEAFIASGKSIDEVVGMLKPE